MRLLHFSDLHFGTETSSIKSALLAHIKEIPADLVVVSGDFTQTGSKAEFIKAKEFLEDIGLPFLCVPGNHDIPRFEFLERMTDPYRKFKKFIAPELSPVLRYKNACIAGMTTSRRALPHWNWANGCVSADQLEELKTVYAQENTKYRVCVMHHPVHKAEGNPLHSLVFGGHRALLALKAMRVNLVLTGHVHHASITTIEDAGHNTVFLSASTALSSRLRIQKNGYNVVTFTEEKFLIEIFHYTNEGFKCLEKLEVNAASPKTFHDINGELSSDLIIGIRAGFS